MAVYAIGDVQGCFDELQKLLTALHFDADQDQIWLAGDLVNRGPKSLETLRFVKSLGDAARVVLGNHDLHLLARAAGVSEHQHRLDTLDAILTATDRDDLIYWLRQQSLFYHDAILQFSMVHAGLPPQWSVDEARQRATEVESVLKSDNWRDFFQHMYGNKPRRWSADLTGWDRLRFITNCFTRLRYCEADAALALKFKGAPKDKPVRQKPWFEMADRQTEQDRIVFGHWSQLGTGQYGNVFSLDSGAVWGQQLTAIRIDQQPYQWTIIEADPAKLPSARHKTSADRQT